MIEYYINSKKGKINVLEGKDIDDCKGIIINIHGLACHFQYIYETLDEITNKEYFFSKYGYKIVGFEFHGHGKSEGRRCTIYDFNDLIIDLNNVIEMIKNKYHNTKIFLLGESMGGAVIIKYIATKINTINGIVLLSPMCGIDKDMRPNYCLEKLLLWTSYILPLLPYGLNKNITEESTTNKYYIDAYNKCSYNFTYKYPLTTLRELYNTSISLLDVAPKITCPCFIVHGENDNITPIKSTIKFYYKINNTNNKLLIINNKGHNLLVPKNKNDNEPMNIYNNILEWLNLISI
jgi:caffeoylshikimate esterase